ncbi:glycosyl hydrolase 53 family protein [uncultured Ruminococcus sp.]|uniref:glycosyl hydrolase 53 family protein n=1 Tax=uncultured Ruminococcus sp. TaxID=165186 RepID=UPI00266EFB7A|nr:glycosyl hydrolase 53 family protein [uncultured Ruminococcus sp.]
MDLTKFPLVSAENDTVYFSQFDMNVNGGEPIRGVDISSILAVENAGVTFCNEYGRKQDIFRTLSEHGVNYIRVRVWNEPYDSRGNSYGGGNCDLYTAAEIGRRAAKYGMKLLVDIQYSDFWADPEKQTRPKYWIQHDHETLKGEIYKYTAWVLETISEAGGNIGMVQVGNETNCFFCGETDMYKICDLFASGDQAIRDFDRSVLIAHHFANPSTGSYAWYAQVMDECNLDYDVFATSYYPYWHGTTENLTAVLKEIADTYNKYVMVAETAYPYTSEDGDTFGNAVSEDSDSAVFRYDISVEGQAQCLTDVFQAVANVGEKGIGVFYWEPAWLGVNGISWEEQSSLWKKYGSGWATDYAAEYDASVTSAGGSSYDNQALFDFEGNSLKSLQVFRNIYPQNNEILNPKGAVIENGRYRIKNVNSELFISEKNGNAVQSNGTVWTFTKNDDDTFYITTLDGRALTVEKSADTNGTNILLQKHKGDTSQKYTLCRNTDGTYALLTAASNNKSCLDVYNISKEDGANICQWEYWGGNGQKFILEPVKEIEGDVNADGALSVIDVILLQKWLLAVPDAELTDWKAADLCEDNIINVFDLHLLKRMLIEQ